MNHRVKNLFTLAGAVVMLSARSARTPRELASNVQTRLAALARAHQLTLPALGEDEAQPSQPMTLPMLVQAIASPYIDQTDADGRIGIAGPPVTVGSTALTSVALLVHELATNAAKYGALSVPEGRVRVDWSEEKDRLLLIWREEGGPAVEKPPVAEGFGSVAMRLAVTAQLEGEVVRDWKRDGLVVRLSVPLARLAT
jgi:two-component system, chemotaxis family, CheB/CheR fusion protein